MPLPSAPHLPEAVRRLYFGWWIVLAAIGLQALVAGLVMQAYGTYVAIWGAEFGWSKTVFALAFALQRGQMALASPFQGWLLQRIGPRRVVAAGVVVMAAGFLLLARFDTILGFYLAFMVLATGMGASGFLSLNATVVNWFERRRSTALAMVQLGIGLGGLLVPLVAWAATTHGWRATTTASGIVVLLVGLPLSTLMRRSPEAYGLHPDGDEDPGDERGPAGEGDFSARQALRTRAFWYVTLGHALAVTLVASVNVHLVVHLNEGLGYSVQTAAGFVGLMTAATVLGQIAGGVLGDRVDKRILATGAMGAHAVALVAVAFAPSAVWVAFFAVLHGIAWGMRGPLMQALRADYFGRSSFPTIMGISFSFVMIGQMVGPLAAGLAADVLGDYRAAFVGLAALVTGGAFFFAFARPPRPLREADA